MYAVVRGFTHPSQYEDPRAVLDSYRGYAENVLRKYRQIQEALGFAGLDFAVQFTRPTGEVATVGTMTDVEGGVHYTLSYSNVARHAKELAERKRAEQNDVPASRLPLVTPKIEVGVNLEPVIAASQPDSILGQGCSDAEYVCSELLGAKPPWHPVGHFVLQGYPMTIDYGAWQLDTVANPLAIESAE